MIIREWTKERERNVDQETNHLKKPITSILKEPTNNKKLWLTDIWSRRILEGEDLSRERDTIRSFDKWIARSS